MTQCVIRDWQGKEAGKAALDLKVAKQSSANDLIHRAVVRQLANARHGTASTLTRAEVAGGGRKPYKQKGTGRARQGSIRTPLRPGGGVVFGPKPRSYTLTMNRKERRLALRTALMSRVDDIIVVQGFGVGQTPPKPKRSPQLSPASASSLAPRCWWYSMGPRRLCDVPSATSRR